MRNMVMLKVRMMNEKLRVLVVLEKRMRTMVLMKGRMMNEEMRVTFSSFLEELFGQLFKLSVLCPFRYWFTRSILYMFCHIA